MAGHDRLSDLPDDLLRRILHFAPAKEGASTTALARRWRSLWPSVGTVNLDSRYYDHLHRFSKRRVVMCHAHKALADAHPVKKLTFRYAEGEDELCRYYDSASYEEDMDEAKRYLAEYLRKLLLTADHVEELRRGLFFGPLLHDLGISSLPTPPALRVLHISKCNDWNWKQHSSQPARIFAYRQTETGKTFTMEGTERDRGVNYRTLEELFKIAEEREDVTYNISVVV